MTLVTHTAPPFSLNAYTRQSNIIGFDEVGRGCVAGPVTVCALALDDAFPLHTFGYASHEELLLYEKKGAYKNVKDSKKLSAKQRAAISEMVFNDNIPLSLISASNKLIDQYGMGTVLSHLMYISIALVMQLGIYAYTIIIDGYIKHTVELDTTLATAIYQENNIDNIHIPLSNITPLLLRQKKADDRYLAVALASNVAKHARDKYMTQLSDAFPLYRWHDNKGYGTLAHMEAIKQEPANPFLRYSFLKSVINDAPTKKMRTTSRKI